MAGNELPDDLSSPDQLLYLSFRELYKQFRSGTITKEQAKVEKGKLLSAHELAAFYYSSYLETVQMRNRIGSQLVELEKCGCPACVKAVRLFDGRDKE
jgi:hypothetical protein